MRFPLLLIYSFDSDDLKSSKGHAVLPSLIFLLKCLSKSFFIRSLIYAKLIKVMLFRHCKMAQCCFLGGNKSHYSAKFIFSSFK